MSTRPVTLCTLVCLAFALITAAAACGVGQKRSGLPSGAQSSIDSITADIARGDYEKITRRRRRNGGAR